MTITLGDFVQTPMASSGQGSLIWTGQKNAQVTIANQDLVNTVTIARRPNFTQNGSNALSLPALGSVTIDGSKSLWALAPAGTLPLIIIPGGGQWAPAPSQVAASINALGLMKDTTGQTINGTLGTPAQDSIRTAIPINISNTGVPLLSNQSQIASQNSVGIAAGATTTSSLFNVNNLSFEFLIVGQTAPIADATPYVLVVLQWVDSVSGLTVAKDSFVIMVGTQIGVNVAPHLLKGPNKGDQVKVTLSSFCTSQGCNLTYTFLTSSRIIEFEQLDMVWNHKLDSGNSGSIPYATRDYPDAQTIATFVNGSLAANATDTFVSPPHNGPAWVNFWETGVAGSNIKIVANPLPTGVYGNTPYILNDIMVAGNPNKLNANIQLPMGPVQWQITNGGSVAANYAGILVGQT